MMIGAMVTGFRAAPGPVDERKMVCIKDIVIPEDFTETQPSQEKIERKWEILNRTGQLPEDIHLNQDGVLDDGYITYLMARQLGIEQVVVRTGTVRVIEARHSERGNPLYWRLPDDLKEVQIGDRCIVWTQYGVAMVRVTAVIDTSDYRAARQLRPVIRIKRNRM